MAGNAVIESITCPITGDIMKDPVQGKDGQTYERTAIMEALAIKEESPITREHMTSADLKVNASIRYLCDKYHAGELGSVERPPRNIKISTDDIKLDHSISKNSSGQLMFTFDINKETMPTELENGHLSQDLILVLDRSGSTCCSVEAMDVDGNKLENGMSILDIVNHAARTVTKTLDKNSRLAIIVFDNHIDVIFELALMTDMNCSRALTEISNVNPRGQTNIWHAVEKAISILNERDDKTRNGAIMMLTDGMPNIKPARGEVETLKRLRKSLNFTAPIYTFGFGYSLERNLLYEMAKYGNGSSGHIPDGGMIATVFCHSIATILATVVVNLQLHITYNEHIQYEQYSPLMGDFAYNVSDENPRCVTVDLGTVQLGQMRHIIMNTAHLNYDFSYYYTYKIGGHGCSTDNTTVNMTTVIECECEGLLNSNVGRFTVVEAIRKIINFKTSDNNQSANDIFSELVNYYTSSGMQDPLTQGIIKNLVGTAPSEGQVKLATTNNEYFMRWGEFYLDQLSRSLNQEIKPNFRDTACPFGGAVFEALVDMASDVFDTLPPPTPSLVDQPQYRGSTAHVRASTLSSYNSQSNDTPCFIGTSTVKLASGDMEQICHLKRGDKVLTLSDPYDIKSSQVEASVVCLLKTIMPGVAQLVTLGTGLKITPWHPVLSAFDWEFPQDIGKVVDEPCKAVYSILLDSGHTCCINDIWCIGLGHSYDYSILKHEYFGSSAIVKDMESLPGWNNGLVVINSEYSIIRDPLTTQIVSIKGKGKGRMVDVANYKVANC